MNYNRILLKLSGEALAGNLGYGIDTETINIIAKKIDSILSKNKQLAIVVGGGNFLRGKSLIQSGVAQATADHIGMLGTVMNAMAIYDTLEKSGVNTMVMSAYKIDNGICQSIDYKLANKFLNKGGVIIFCAGTGHPFFTTDTAAALRSIEIKADLLIKVTQVDGIYDDDPFINPNAKKFDTLTFDQAISKKLKIMDTSAFALCQENNLPIAVINIHQDDSLNKLLTNQPVGTLVQ